MIILDTNVISEAMKPDPDPRVKQWLNNQAVETLYLSSVVLAELLFGVAALPSGKRKSRLAAALGGVTELFGERVLIFDISTAEAYAQLMSQARTAGLAISVADGYIAATAVANGMLVATRDAQPFEAGGVQVINPWKPE